MMTRSQEFPARVGSWVLERQLGAGGMGVVFLGRHENGTLAAVKLLHPWLLADQTARTRLRREAAALRRVSGPCVARVLDVQLDAAVPFVACEYIDGPTLAQHVETQGTLAGDQLRAFALGLADALRMIHDTGTIHRDLTATNVLLAVDGPKVVDFGIAHSTDATRVTAASQVIGTPRWMAPELIRGAEPTTAGDVFAWGALVAFAASGKPPFGVGPAESLVYRIVHDEPDIPTLADHQLEDLCRQALQKDPSARPSPVELVAALLDPSAAATVELALTRAWQYKPTRELTRELGRGLPPTRSRHMGLAVAGTAAALLAGSFALFTATSDPGRHSSATAGEPNSDTGTPDGASASPVPSEAPSSDPAMPAAVEPVATAPRPRLPAAPWAVAPVEPVGEVLPEAVAMWRDVGWDGCQLYGPTEMEQEQLGFTRAFSPEPTRMGDFTFGWTSESGDYVSVSIWDVKNQNILDYFGDPRPTRYSDGSEVRMSSERQDFALLLAIPGQDCFYELTAGSNVAIGWAQGSFRPLRH